MGRRSKLSQAEEQECQLVLDLINQDLELRNKEQDRLNKIEHELNEAANQRNLLAKRREFNEKCCILCCATFNLLFNKRLLCTLCQLYVCRNCATWDSQDKKWLCRVCDQQRVLYVQSCEWFYDHIKQRFKHFGSAKILDTLRRKRKESGVDSENDSGYGPAEGGRSMKSSPLSFLLPLHAGDRTKAHKDDNASAQPGLSAGEEEEDEDLEKLSEVRRHIETVVQGLVGENLDTAHVDKLYTHPQYLQLFSSFHSRLVEAVTKLCQALDVALNNKPEQKGTPPGTSENRTGREVTPTTAHASLKQVILDVAQQAAFLPTLHEQPEVSAGTKQNGSDFMTSCLFQSYQELLASAIINKLVEQSQNQFSPNQKIRREDSELSSNSDTDIHMVSACKDGVCSDQSAASETESLETESSLGGVDPADDEFSWATGIKDDAVPPPRVEYVIEERIEEVTEEEITDSDGNHQKSKHRQEETKRWPIRRQASRQKSVEDPVSRATFDVPTGNSLPDLDFLNAWDIVESRRVPFPEFGVDIVENKFWDESNFYYGSGQEDEEEEEEFDNVGSRLSSVPVWEDNWLFRKRKLFPYGSLRHQLLGFYGEPPCMLIPNPLDEPSSHPQIDTRDVDQLSELSEQNSIGSLDLTDSESETEFRESQKLVELAQNVAHHFNSRHLESATLYQSPSETLVYRTRALDPQSLGPPSSAGSSVYERQNVRRETALPHKEVEDTLPMPRFLPQSQRAVASHDPYFSVPPTGISIHAGKVASFQCQVKGTKPYEVAWFKDDAQLLTSDRVEIFHHDQNSQYFLNIYDTEIMDSGSYSCVVFGGQSENWKDFSVEIRGTTRSKLSPEFVGPLRLSKRGNCDGSVLLTCAVSGYPEPRLYFFHNKQPVNHSSKYTFECVGYGEWHLRIHNVESSDEGEYEAYTRNSLGHCISTLLLKLSDIVKPEREPDVSRVPTSVKEKKNSEPSNFLLKPLDRQTLRGPVDLSPPSPAPRDLSCPPRPGTIAEREHHKWETAAPLPNNPYSAENQAKRKLERRISDVSLTSPDMTFEEFERQRMLDHANAVSNVERYCRDYYVNDLNLVGSSSSKSSSRRNSALHPNEMTQESLDALQNKVYMSADQVSSLEGQVRLLERELELASAPNQLDQLQTQVARAAAQVDNSSKQVSRVESEVRRLRKTLSSESDRSNVSDALPLHRVPTFTSEEEAEELCNLPSVKHLANLFAPASNGLSNNNNSNDNHNMNGIHLSKQTYPEKEVVIVDSPPLVTASLIASSADQVTGHQLHLQPKYKVHSLTARSLSKEFRQQVARHVPRPMNRTLSATPPSGSCSSSQPTSLDTERSASPLNPTLYNSSNNPSPLPQASPLNDTARRRHTCDGLIGSGGGGGGYTSDESSASNTSLPRTTRRRPISKSILQRTNYWEQRAEQGLLSDNSVSEEFPAPREN